MATTFGRILVRRDTAANWSATNPVLANGEPGWDTTNKVFKVGDGTTVWNSLPAITGGGGGGSGVPVGGTTGQALVKNSNTSGDVSWSSTVPIASNAVKLQTARTIAGKSFDGTGNITIATVDLSNFTTTVAADGEVPAYDADANKYTPVDLTDLYAPVDSNGRIAEGAWQKYFLPSVVVNEGDPAPADFPTGGIVYERPAPVSLVPTFAGSGFATGASASTLAVNTTAAFNVNDWIAVAVVVDASTTPVAPPTTITSITPATGAWTANAGPTTFQSGTVQVNIQYYKVTTLIPSGTAVTLTISTNRVHRIMAFAKMPNLVASSPLDVTAVNSGGSSSTLSLSVGPTSARTVADELGLLLIGHNDSTTATRTIVGTNNWTVLAAVESDNATTSRTMTLLYQVFSATGTTTGTANVVASDGATGAWAGAVATFKKA
jgi:hypothetical protein